MPDVLFLPVKPRYMADILGGSKTAELRTKRMTHVPQFTKIVFYETRPVGRVVATAVSGMTHTVSVRDAPTGPDIRVECNPSRSDLRKLAISDDEIVAYLKRDSCKTGVADVWYGEMIEFDDVKPVQHRADMHEIMEALPGFRVPQSYCWLRGNWSDAIIRLCGVEK